MKQMEMIDDCENNLSFDVNKAFFIIDSNNLCETKERFIGYVLQDDDYIFNADDLKPDAVPYNVQGGVYIYIKKEEDVIKIYQDQNGSYGLYLYKENDYFALSNSFLYLLDYVKKNHKISFNKDLADHYLTTGQLCTAGLTLVNEIEELNRAAALTIDIKSKKISVSYIDYKEKTIDLSSKDAFEILDNWHLKYTNLIRKLYQNGENIIADLSGGLDSRMTFSLLASANIDLDKIFFKSANSDYYSHREDYKIASKIGEYFKFGLNKKENLKFDYVHKNSISETYNLLYSIMGGFHDSMYYLTFIKRPYAYRFTGYGGEAIRPYWPKTYDAYMKRMLRIVKKRGYDYKDIIQGDKNALMRGIDYISNKWMSLTGNCDETNVMNHLWKDTYNVHHFGKYSAALFQVGEIAPNPLLDPNLAKLKLNDAICEDENLLMAIILTRFTDDLLQFEFARGKTIDPATLDRARQLNEKYPFKKPDFEYLTREQKDSSPNDMNFYETPATTEDLNEYIKKVFFSTNVRKLFETKYQSKIYKILSENTKGVHVGIASLNAAVVISKVIADVMANEAMSQTSYFDYLENQTQYYSEENVFTKKDVKEKAKKLKGKKLSTMEKIFSVTNLYKNKEKHKRIMLLGIKITI